MVKLLFSSDGRIGSQDFIKGAVILLALNFFLWLAWFGSVWLGIVAGVISLGLIYCWCCLFAKRFHDAGLNGWMFLVVFAIFWVLVSWILPTILGPFLPVSDRAVELSEKLAVISEEMMVKQPSPEESMQILNLYGEYFSELSLVTAILFFISGAIVAFGTNKLLKTDPNPNQWG